MVAVTGAARCLACEAAGFRNIFLLIYGLKLFFRGFAGDRFPFKSLIKKAMNYCNFLLPASRSGFGRCSCNAESRRYMVVSDCSCEKRIGMASRNVT